MASLKPISLEPAPQAVRLGHLLHTPNLLTLCRVISVPFLLALISEHRFRYALYLFAAAAVTDGLDGAVARWYSGKSELGAFLDPFADKLMLVSAFIALTIDRVFPVWLFAMIAVRDVVTVFGYFMVTWFVGERIPVRPTILGKASTFFQIVSVVAALAQLNLHQPEMWRVLLYCTVVATGFSGLQYMYRGLLLLSTREPQMFA